jgi:signal transduction histidine kinase
LRNSLSLSMKFKEKKLLLAFSFLILLTLLIGLVGISQIQELNRKIGDLGKHNLRLENAVLEMRINNAIYAMGIRNYVFWRAWRYLGAAPMVANTSSILETGENFKKQLKIYRESAYLDQQKEWATQIAVSFDELFLLGKKIIASVEREGSEKISDVTNSLLMNFENRIYKIDGFLDNSMGKSNLLEVQRQMDQANTDKDQAIFFLRFSLTGALAVGTFIAFAVYKRRIKERSYRQQLFNRMINLEEGERKKLSTAVHDEMGQDLSALKIYLGLISQQPEVFGVDLKSKVEECKKITSRLIDKSHNIAFILRPPDLDEVGLLESLESLLLESQHLTGVSYSFQKPTEELNLSLEYSLIIYRAAQEFLTNMAKHAQAKNVEIRLAKPENSLELFYHDDGKGFNSDNVGQKYLRRKEDKLGLGLLGLKERIEVLDGQMRINSSLGKGTTIIVTLPI